MFAGEFAPDTGIAKRPRKPCSKEGSGGGGRRAGRQGRCCLTVCARHGDRQAKRPRKALQQQKAAVSRSATIECTQLAGIKLPVRKSR